eukprot:2967813-Pleurochrysis_carterae.AAC.1
MQLAGCRAMISSIEGQTRQDLAAPTLVGIRSARSDSTDACQIRTRTGHSRHDSSNSPSSNVGFTYPGGNPEVDPAHEGSLGSYGSDGIGESGVTMRSLSDDALSDACLGDGSGWDPGAGSLVSSDDASCP